MDLWYATLPAPHLRQMAVVAKEPLIEGVRYNIGSRTLWNPSETIDRILMVVRKKEFWLDLKGGQPRVERWSIPPAGQIILNHKIISLDLPAEILFRHEDEWLDIVAFKGNEIFVDPPPRVTGQGQAANIRGTNLKFDGYLTAEDIAFIEAGRDIGIHRYMLSYVEKASDIEALLALDPKAEIVAKIETSKGLDFVLNVYPSFDQKVRLLAACDDLYINIGEDMMLDALYSIVSANPKAIAASRLFPSLQDAKKVSLSDLSHYYLLQAMGYRSFMLSDRLCAHPESFFRAIKQLKRLKESNYQPAWRESVRHYIERFGFWR